MGPERSVAAAGRLKRLQDQNILTIRDSSHTLISFLLPNHFFIYSLF